MIKVALCLAGYFNSQRDKKSLGTDGFNYIKRNILDRPNLDVDIFIHSWDMDRRLQIENLYKDWIKETKFEEQIDFKPLYESNGLNNFPIRSGVTPFWNSFSQYYSVQESFLLLEPYKEEYDIVIRSRFDLGMINRDTPDPYNVQCINLDTNLDMSYVYFAEWKQHHLDYEGPADIWFYSSPENMSKFTRLYNITSQTIKYDSEYVNWAGVKDGGPLNTQKGWKWFFIQAGLWDKMKSIRIMEKN